MPEPTGDGIPSIPSPLNNPHIQAHIRWMERRDLPDVFYIEDASFALPRGEEGLRRLLVGQDNYVGLVAEYKKRVVGFVIYELRKKRLYIVDLAVHPEFRQRGVGRQLVQERQLIEEIGRKWRCTKIRINVRETNLGAQFFFAANSFKAIRVIREYFQDTGEDAYLFQYRVKQNYRGGAPLSTLLAVFQQLPFNSDFGIGTTAWRMAISKRQLTI